MHIEINEKKVQKCLWDFRIAFAFPVCFIAKDYKKVVSYSQIRILKDSMPYTATNDITSLCHYIRENPICDERCIHSDINACILCEQSGGKLNYRCWIGFNEYCVAVKGDGTIYGFLLAGQNVTAGLEKETLATILKKCKEIGLKEDVVAHCFKWHRILDSQQQEAAQSILNACASYLIAEGAVFTRRESDEIRLDSFLNKNLQNDLSISVICMKLGFSKARVYKISQELYGTSIQKAILRKRIEKSCELLENTSSMIRDIASEVGIYDYNYFTKLFRSEKGMTPRDYRKSHSLIEIPIDDGEV